MKLAKTIGSLGLLVLFLVVRSNGAVDTNAAKEQITTSLGLIAMESTGVLSKWLADLIAFGTKNMPSGKNEESSAGSIGLFFELIRGLGAAATRTGILDEDEVMETIEQFGEPFLTGFFDRLEPKWSVEMFSDGENSANDLLPQAYSNKYAWAGDFHKECGMGIMVHSAGTGGYVGFTPTFPTITFRDASGKVMMRESFSDPLGVLGGTVLGLRAGIVIGCPKEDIVEAVVASVGVNNVTDGSTLIPTTLYKVTADLKAKDMKIDVLIPDVIPIIDANSVRSMLHYDNNDCHVAFAPLQEIGVPFGKIPAIWTMDVCADDVGSTLTPTVVFQKGEFKNSLQNKIIWDFECEEGGLFNGRLGKCWYCIVEVVPDLSKLATFDLNPLLYYGTKGDLSVPTSDSTDRYFAPLEQINIDDFVDASALVLEPVSGNSVLACTLSGFIYQSAYAAQSIETSIENLDNALAAVELGYGQQCYLCGTFLKDCKKVPTPFLVSTTTYIWQLETCGNYIFFGTFDQTGPLGSALLSLIQFQFGFDLEDLNLPPDYEGALEEGLGALLLSLFLQDVITKDDLGFDVWYIQKKNVATGWFKPLVVDGFRGLEPKSDSLTVNGDRAAGCDNDFWTEYDSMAPTTNGVRKMVCHSKPDGSEPTLLIGSAVFDDRSSSTYVVHLDAKCKNA